MPDKFVVWGAGGHGRMVSDLVCACGHYLVGFVDADASKLGRTIEPGGARVVFGQQEFLESVRERGCYPEGIEAVALAVGENVVRQRCLQQLRRNVLPTLVHPTAAVSSRAVLGRGTVVFPGAVVNTGASIGEGVIINSAAVIEHDCQISDAAHVSPGAVLAGGVRLGERSWVGAGATVVPGVEIGADVTIGAGAVVLRPVPDGVTVVGVPAVPIQRRSD